MVTSTSTKLANLHALQQAGLLTATQCRALWHQIVNDAINTGSSGGAVVEPVADSEEDDVSKRPRKKLRLDGFVYARTKTTRDGDDSDYAESSDASSSSSSSEETHIFEDEEAEAALVVDVPRPFMGAGIDPRLHFSFKSKGDDQGFWSDQDGGVL